MFLDCISSIPATLKVVSVAGTMTTDSIVPSNCADNALDLAGRSLEGMSQAIGDNQFLLQELDRSDAKRKRLEQDQVNLLSIIKSEGQNVKDLESVVKTLRHVNGILSEEKKQSQQQCEVLKRKNEEQRKQILDLKKVLVRWDSFSD